MLSLIDSFFKHKQHKKEDKMVVGEFLEFCRARSPIFSSPELNPLLGDNVKNKVPVVIESNKFLR